MSRSRVLAVCAVAVTAIVAALPTIAHADDYWKDNGVQLGGKDKAVPFNLQGKKSFTVGGVVIGPCSTVGLEELWNDTVASKMGEGERSAYAISVPCKTSIPGCEVAEAFSKKMPWPVTLLPGDVFEVQKVVIDFVFQEKEACKALSGATLPMKGVIPGIFENPTSCVVSEEDEGLVVEALEVPVLVSGEDCYEGEEYEGALETEEE